MTPDALRDLGCRTLEANRAGDALRRRELDQSIDLLVTDIVRRGVVERCRSASRVDQTSPAIFSSALES